ELWGQWQQAHLWNWHSAFCQA
ncbi:mCG146525, partial [Mus musculus]